MENLTLYVKGMSPSEMEDVWDDTVLNKAYDKALRMAKEDVAKRIAMDTCTTGCSSKGKSEKGKEKAKKETPKPKPVKAAEWKEGMPCRAVYEEDGLEYEAFLMSFIDDEECIVRFLGYENSETVAISSLKPTRGNEARMRQLQEATVERGDDGFGSQEASESVDNYSDDRSTPGPTENMRTNKKKKSNKKYRSQFGDLPTIPMPNMNMFRNMDGDAPLPPPPPPLMSLAGSDVEHQAISDMLLSWYMTGYYTGLYQGIRKQRQSRRYN